ncbi:PH domain-containing protein [Agromyces mariniharenae]|uniref:PH domain-containing protein n=1 Tax=Agromyces mariniharenae TaxID=2604423 RepID=A0A5S4V215_9MICO|nr:PH domain-containing protein [Agromyces mariniharenae]TYL53177.1 PH domain-containing protein [Agromyces mariniharenae]
MLFDPKVQKYLIADEGEVIVDEVRKHWAVIIGPTIEILLAIPALLLLGVMPSTLYWVPIFLSLALALHGGWRILEAQMDRFVITNMRVFRVHGILSQSQATMPLARILDISVHRPIIGRILGYGHFVFESAAQEQGLREIRFVGRPNERGLTIQRVIARSGLRGPVRRQETPAAPPPPPQTVPPPPPVPVVTVAPVTSSDAPTGPIPVAHDPDAPYDPDAPHDPNDTAEIPWWRAAN